MLGCALPLIITAFAGRGKALSIVWIVLALGGMFLLHWIAMRFMHKGNQKKTPPDELPQKDQSSRDDHTQCH